MHHFLKKKNPIKLWAIFDTFATLQTQVYCRMLPAGIQKHVKLYYTYYLYFASLTDDVQILLEVKKRDATSVQTFPCQLKLQFLLQGRVWTHSIDPYYKTILQERTQLSFMAKHCNSVTYGPGPFNKRHFCLEKMHPCCHHYNGSHPKWITNELHEESITHSLQLIS